MALGIESIDRKANREIQTASDDLNCGDVQFHGVDYQNAFIIRTASRDLEGLVRKGVLKKVGTTGRSIHYVLGSKPDINWTNRTVDCVVYKPNLNPTNPI